MKRAGVQKGDDWHPEYLCYGIPVGTREYCQHMLLEKVQEVRTEVDRVKQVLREDDS